MTLRVVELFSGIGAQRMALTLAGIPHEVVGVSEIDEPAIRSYTAIYGDCPNLGDITKVETLPPCDLLTYSFPCQDLSIQGKKQGMGWSEISRTTGIPRSTIMGHRDEIEERCRALGDKSIQ